MGLLRKSIPHNRNLKTIACLSSRSDMNHIEIFFENKKKRIIFTAILLVFWVPALAIRFFSHDMYILHMRADMVATVLQIVGLPFIFLSMKYLKCPACKENAGSGWDIKKCKNCGELLK
ncbi:MAG: hypothetical protein EOO07_11740 [Chitinophagaceae bacterium]|nr:MAG: hypothetical protein EOO07_11740 [Chitinophagaceae bacterium]